MPSPRPRAFSEALARQQLQPQCSTCGGPEAIPLTITLLYDGEELGRCEACGHALDVDGRPVGDGQNLRVVRLVGCPRRAAVEETDPLLHS